MKRIFDFFLSIFFMIMLFPLLLLISCCLIMFYGRPIFFLQVRAGFKGKPFKIIKFRTYKNDSNDLISDSVRIYEGRVLIKDNDSFEIKKEGDNNYIKEEINFGLSKNLLNQYNLKTGDQIKLIYKTDNIEVSGKVKSEIDLVNTISMTGLFGEMATMMQKSENKDWSMDLPILDYEIVTIKK